MRRGSLVSLLGIGLVAGGIAAAVALLIPWLPPVASKERVRIDDVFWFTVVICIVIFAIVAAVLIYSVFAFRAAPDDDSDGPPTHGNTTLEIVWTLIPTLLVTAIGIFSAVVLAKNDALGKNVFKVNVTAQQFAWSFSYPEAGNVTTGVLRLPVNRSVLLDLKSLDVIHSFWVPEFGQKEDTVPGLHTSLHITPTKIGSYDIICTELCGLGHATMRSTAIVMSDAAFDKWLASQKKAAGGTSAASVSGAAVFKNNPCAGCHTLTAAGATGKVGPDLDKLPQWAQQAHQPLESFIRTSIVNPNAYVQPGFHPNIMPPFSSLPKPQLDALVQYLIQSSKKG
ncbi:MAG TPA: cytochrome c oxidase subunit II [Gaiellaceae bacterium]|nr:cytochrome c oxidase subunit II [Gaiellaceae bacterium]